MRSPPDVPCPDGGCPTVLGPGIPDLCVNGTTLVTVIPCGADNPTLDVACQNVEWRTVLDCSAHPLVLPATGTASIPIAGTGLFAIVAGVLLLRVSSRRVVARPARR